MWYRCAITLRAGRQCGKPLNQNHHYYQISRMLEAMSATDAVATEKGKESTINSPRSKEGERSLAYRGSEGADDSLDVTGGKEGEEDPDLQKERQDALREAIQMELEPRAEVLRYDVFTLH